MLIKYNHLIDGCEYFGLGHNKSFHFDVEKICESETF